MISSIDKMVQVGMHFGHQASKWNPKMLPFIYGEQNGIHIIDLIQTYWQLKHVNEELTKLAGEGKSFLFVGTKKQAARLIANVARECDSYYINQRWLGGMLTNWQTIKTSIAKLNILEKQELNGDFEKLPKKEAATYRKEKENLEKYLGGVKTMKKLPDIVIIIGQPEEMNAVRECKKLGIKTITILDTNCDPTLADLFIAANDDSVTSLQYILSEFLDAIKKGKKQYQEKNKNIKEKIRIYPNKGNREGKSMRTIKA
uniref:Small ribosomal subunit protein uS2c n=1 Tax=Fusochloris perforata TaxID=106203 RepID=A0A097KPW3_9CHLO|nr:ribosomal protein S2 [Fusochloris perforata]AIT95212.1 ribosomal protein S2 [Fusochloris perforata]